MNFVLFVTAAAKARCEHKGREFIIQGFVATAWLLAAILEMR